MSTQINIPTIILESINYKENDILDFSITDSNTILVKKISSVEVNKLLNKITNHIKNIDYSRINSDTFDKLYEIEQILGSCVLKEISNEHKKLKDIVQEIFEKYYDYENVSNISGDFYSKKQTIFNYADLILTNYNSKKEVVIVVPKDKVDLYDINWNSILEIIEHQKEIKTLHLICDDNSILHFLQQEFFKYVRHKKYLMLTKNSKETADFTLRTGTLTDLMDKITHDFAYKLQS